MYVFISNMKYADKNTSRFCTAYDTDILLSPRQFKFGVMKNSLKLCTR